MRFRKKTDMLYDGIGQRDRLQALTGDHDSGLTGVLLRRQNGKQTALEEAVGIVEVALGGLRIAGARACQTDRSRVRSVRNAIAEGLYL